MNRRIIRSDASPPTTHPRDTASVVAVTLMAIAEMGLAVWLPGSALRFLVGGYAVGLTAVSVFGWYAWARKRRGDRKHPRSG